MIRARQLMNNSHSVLYMPFQQDVADYAKGGTDVKSIVNNGVVIRNLSSYAIPIPENGAKNAAYFDETSNIIISHSDDFNFSRNLFYIGIWIYPTVEDTLLIYSHQKHTANYNGWSLFLKDTPKIGFQVADDLGWSSAYYNVSYLNTWLYVEILNLGGFDFIHINGEYAHSNAQTKNTDYTTQLEIGSRFGGQYKFSGYMQGLIIKKLQVYKDLYKKQNAPNRIL